MELVNIKGIGPKTVQLLSKLGIYNLTDLITYYPYRYDIIKRSDIDALLQDEKIIIDGVIETKPSLFYFNRKMDKMSFKLNTGSRLINVVIFNRGFLKNKLAIGQSISIIGKYDLKHNTAVASELRFGLLPDKPTMECVYHSTFGLSGKQIGLYINEALKEVHDVIDYIPETYKEKNEYLDKMTSIRSIHNPIQPVILKQSILRLKYEELFLFMLKMNTLKFSDKNRSGIERIVNYELVKIFISKLPFTLTKDQLSSVESIYQDLISKRRMNRLLQGDVGSGKTIVAIIALYINYLSGYQGALMAPTEILANQHYQNITKLFKDYNINIGLLTGHLKAKEKRDIAKQIEDGKLDMVIGTHALITENVNYNNLGLVITDEQHRFGVNQRGNLKNKGQKPDILYMSATPIPRTFALTLYGDMDISNIKTLPAGKKDIITILKKDNDIKDVLEMMFEELKQDHQIYVVAPLIEESDKIDLENVDELYDKMHKAFGKLYNVGILHGKMSSKEKDQIMEEYQANKIQILISTTVIEVGVDVKNATMIVIFDAFRFGLSALHQLRGRVGRNNVQSYCVLVSNKEVERLNVLVKTNDGFKISEEDFMMRGSGDLFGIRQSGDMTMKIANFKNDYPLLLQAKEDTENFLKEKQYLLSSNQKFLDIIKQINALD